MQSIYTSLHLLIPNSQSIPLHSPSPLANTVCCIHRHTLFPVNLSMPMKEAKLHLFPQPVPLLQKKKTGISERGMPWLAWLTEFNFALKWPGSEVRYLGQLLAQNRLILQVVQPHNPEKNILGSQIYLLVIVLHF